MAKINIGDLTNVTWENGAGCDNTPGDCVDIWRINITANLPLLNAFSAVMTSDEHDRAGKYHFDKDQKRFIISRGALRIILGRYMDVRPREVVFEIGYNKKPNIKNSKLHYNLSHSGQWILLAVSNAPVGVDVELINKTFAFKDVLDGNFSSPEINYINGAGSAELFFKLWTRKEALVKATGKGLDEDLKSIPSLDGSTAISGDLLPSVNDWQIHSFAVQEHYIASVAGDKPADKMRLWHADF